MKALKGLLIYIGIALAMVLGVCVLLFAGMYFFPTFRIAGIGIVHKSKTVVNEEIDFSNYSNFDNIELTIGSKRVNVEIVPTEEKFTYTLQQDVFGIVYDMTEYAVIKTISQTDNTIKVNLNVTEPNGLWADNNSELKICLPKNHKYNAIINTNKGQVNIDSCSLNSLNVTTTSGNVSLTNCGELINDERYLILDALNLSTDTGNFDLSSVSNLTVNSVIKLNANDGDFNFGNIKAGLDIAGTGVRLTAKTISTSEDGFRFISENGFFKIDKIITGIGTENTIVTENCDVQINEIFGKTAIITTYGNINITTLNDKTTLSSEHGNINIKQAYEDLRITTDFGNITVSSYLMNGKFVSRKGNIDVKSIGEYQKGIRTEIQNEDGAINVDNKINQLIVKTTGMSKVTVTYREIKGGLTNIEDVFQHKVTLGQYSSAIVYMPTANYNTPFKFKAKGNISGEISGLISEYEGDEVRTSDEYQFFPSASKETQELCKESCYFDFLGTIEFRGYINK